ncbi:MAG: thiamine-phosphate kinase, partial [Acidimicrobiales bacterium]
MIRESALIGRLRSRLPAIGDDAAVVAPPAGRLVLCADASVAGLHADLGLVGMDDFGWKALVTALSDIAAMGAVPAYALVTVSGKFGASDFDLLFDGLLAAAVTYGCPVVGGDLTGGGDLVVSVAVVGGLEGEPVRRSGARAGDTLFVTGPLGAAAGGLMALRKGKVGEDIDLALAHRRPRPRLAEGQAARRAGATAMIDISDGLASEVGHLAR